MHKRTALILAGLALPIVALLVMAQPGAPRPAAPTVAASAAPSKPGAVSVPPARLPATGANASPAVQAASKTPASLDEARERLKKRLAVLEQMTPEQWAEEQKQKTARAKWDSLTPQQKLQALQRRNEKLQRQAEQTFQSASPAAGEPAAKP